LLQPVKYVILSNSIVVVALYSISCRVFCYVGEPCFGSVSSAIHMYLKKHCTNKQNRRLLRYISFR